MNLDDVINATNDNGGVQVISEQHDVSKIKVDLPTEQDKENRIRRMSSRPGWDKHEWRMTETEARRIVEEGSEAEKEALIQRGIDRANLATINGRVAMFSAREVPWHGLGTVLSDAPTSELAMKYAGHDFTVSKQKLTFRGQELEAWGTFRDDLLEQGDVEGAFFSQVGRLYQPFQQHDAYDLMDELLADWGARYETGGAIANGKKIWILARVPEPVQAAGEEHELYLMFWNDHAGEGAAKLFMTSNRPVCQNTAVMALNGRKGGISARHTKGIKDKLGEAKRLFKLSKEAVCQYQADANLMATAEVTEELVEAYIQRTVDSAYCTKDEIAKDKLALAQITDETERVRKAKSLDKKVEKRQGLVDDIVARWESERCPNNIWGLYNAVSEAVDHGPLVGRVASAQRRLESTFDGKALNLKAEAWTQAVALVQ